MKKKKDTKVKDKNLMKDTINDAKQNINQPVELTDQNVKKIVSEVIKSEKKLN